MHQVCFGVLNLNGGNQTQQGVVVFFPINPLMRTLEMRQTESQVVLYHCTGMRTVHIHYIHYVTPAKERRAGAAIDDTEHPTPAIDFPAISLHCSVQNV